MRRKKIFGGKILDMDLDVRREMFLECVIFRDFLNISNFFTKWGEAFDWEGRINGIDFFLFFKGKSKI